MNAECLCAVLWEWISMKKKKDALRSLSCGFLISVCDTSGPLEVSFCIPEQETDNLVDCSTIYTLIKCSIFPVFGKNAAWRKQSILITLIAWRSVKLGAFVCFLLWDLNVLFSLTLKPEKEKVLLVNSPLYSKCFMVVSRCNILLLCVVC